MRMTEEDFDRLQRRRTSVLPKKPAKYRNTKVVIDGNVFSSKKEAERYLVLKDDQADGRIRNLVIQPVFVLAPSVILRGKKKPSLRYYADFSYEAGNGGDWVFVVEDVKSEVTKANALYRAKLHLMKWVHDIDVEEV